jgi:predicted phage-related endonuclease
MSTLEISSKVQELRELQRMADELAAEIAAIQDTLKAHMTVQGVDTLAGADYKVTWKEVTSSRLDSKALKAALPELAAQYTRQTTTRRFCVA